MELIFPSKEYLQSYIDSILYSDFDWDDDYDEGIQIDGKIYGRIFHSDMTGMDVAIVSENKSDVENISDDDFLDWLYAGDESERSGQPFDWNNFNGLTVLEDESGDLGCMYDVVLFEVPLTQLVLEYDVDTDRDVLKYATKFLKIFYFVYGDDEEYGGLQVDVVEYSRFRF